MWWSARAASRRQAPASVELNLTSTCWGSMPSVIRHACDGLRFDGRPSALARSILSHCAVNGRIAAVAVLGVLCSGRRGVRLLLRLPGVVFRMPAAQRFKLHTHEFTSLGCCISHARGEPPFRHHMTCCLGRDVGYPQRFCSHGSLPAAGVRQRAPHRRESSCHQQDAACK